MFPSPLAHRFAVTTHSSFAGGTHRPAVLPHHRKSRREPAPLQSLAPFKSREETLQGDLLLQLVLQVCQLQQMFLSLPTTLILKILKIDHPDRWGREIPQGLDTGRIAGRCNREVGALRLPPFI